MWGGSGVDPHRLEGGRVISLTGTVNAGCVLPLGAPYIPFPAHPLTCLPASLPHAVGGLRHAACVPASCCWGPASCCLRPCLMLLGHRRSPSVPPYTPLPADAVGASSCWVCCPTGCDVLTSLHSCCCRALPPKNTPSPVTLSLPSTHSCCCRALRRCPLSTPPPCSPLPPITAQLLLPCAAPYVHTLPAHPLPPINAQLLLRATPYAPFHTHPLPPITAQVLCAAPQALEPHPL